MGTFGGATTDALAPNIGLAFPLSAGTGDPDQSVANRDTLDQPTVEDKLKDEMKSSEGWQSAHEAGYQGLTAGIPLVTNIMFTMADQIWDMTPLGFLPFHPSDVLDFISAIPILGSIIPGLDASKIISGQFPMEMITGLIDALAETVQGLVDQFFGVVGQPVSAFVNILRSLGGLFPALTPNDDGTASAMPLADFVISSGTAILNTGVGGALQLIDGAAQTIENALSGFLGIFGTHQGSLNAIASGLQGATTAAASVNDVQVAAQNASNTLASNTGAILALQQGSTVPPGGVLDITDFATMDDATSLGGNFNQIYYGTSGATHVLGVEDGKANWYPTSGPYPDQDRSCVAIKNNVETTGDDQMIGVSYASSYEDKCADFIFGRANLTGDTFVMAWFSNGSVFLWSCVSNTYTLFKKKAFSKNPSAAYYLKCGPGRVYRIYENSTEILNHTEVGTTSAMGSGFRRAGFGGTANSAVFYWVPFFLRPGKVTALSIADVA